MGCGLASAAVVPAEGPGKDEAQYGPRGTMFREKGLVVLQFLQWATK